jgi:hypothetical protein
MEVIPDSTGKVTINCLPGIEIQLLDITGELVHQFTSTSGKESLDLKEHCTSGVYFLKSEDVTFQVILESDDPVEPH